MRVSYLNNGSGAEVLEENNYYPFGLKHEGYNTLAEKPEVYYYIIKEFNSRFSVNYLIKNSNGRSEYCITANRIIVTYSI